MYPEGEGIGDWDCIAAVKLVLCPGGVVVISPDASLYCVGGIGEGGGISEAE